MLFGTPSAVCCGYEFHGAAGHRSWFSVVGVWFSMSAFAASSAYEHREPAGRKRRKQSAPRQATTEHQPGQQDHVPTGMDQREQDACRTALDSPRAHA